MACTVADIITLMEGIAPPGLAESWDNVGLQTGSRRAEVSVVLVSLDAHPRTLEEARSRGAGLLICHHPLIFRPLHRVLTDEPAGDLLCDALTSGIAVYAAHTNLDASLQGVNVALAELFSLRDHRPLLEAPAGEGYKLVTFLPPEHAGAVSAALFEAGAGVIGDYTGCSFQVRGSGTFVPGPGANPAYASGGGPNEVSEVRLETVLEADMVGRAVEALLASHPYEEPAYDVYRLHVPAGTGLGRIGDLAETLSLDELARRCRDLLHSPAPRVAGDASTLVRSLAVCGGSGGKMAARALEAGAQAMITGDVDYHEAQEALSAGLAIIDAGHYHTEWPVVPRLASLLAGRAEQKGLEVEILVSDVNTDPWSNGGAE